MATAAPHNPPFRAEHIGSLLRPPELLQARADEAGRLSDFACRGLKGASVHYESERLFFIDDKSNKVAVPLLRINGRLLWTAPTVVLGIVSSKLPQLESKDDLKRRIDEAAKHIDLDQLGISPQCGFASTAPGNKLTPDEQRAKLRRVGEVAREVWG
jgi:methionine synthase II (cobalamin-independent)